ncbi:MAG: acyltransferase [Duganella sp.]
MNHSASPLATHSSANLPWLDGLRGLAALWVLLHHIQILVGAPHVAVVSWGELAVDLFMLMSGFLMAHHYIARKNSEPWNHSGTVLQFWLRRFFRIAPLYYLALLAALLLGPQMGQFRAEIASVWPWTSSAPERYLDQSLENILMHVSFLFGFSPYYAFRTALPDWSIGLEMQFYLFFPFIMLLMARLSPLVATGVMVAIYMAARLLFRDFIHGFPMPAFLLLKLYVFLIGIWIAQARAERSMLRGLLAGVALALLWMLLERNVVAVARVALVIALFYLMNNGTLPGSSLLAGATVRVRTMLSNRLAVFMGETSYSVYLVHLLIVIPVSALCSRHPGYLTLHAAARMAVVTAVALPISYLVGWVLFNTVEKKGIAAGKRLLHKLKMGRKVPA